MALPGRAQTFAIESCRDMLEKLDWELHQLKGDALLDPTTCRYTAFNAAVTAWQIADWVAQEANKEQKKAIGFKTLQGLQSIARQNCRALHLCRQVATASKHRMVTQHPDLTVDAGVEFGAPKHVSGPVHLETWTAYFIDGDKKLPAIQVLDEALHYWTGVIYGNRISGGHAA